MHREGTDVNFNSLAEALQLYVSITREGSSVEAFLNQTTLFGDEARTQLTDELLKFIGSAKSAKAVSNYFKTYVAASRR